MTRIMSGEANDAQIAALLIAFRMKGESVDEIAGCAEVMRAKARAIAAPEGDVIDTCGTGGDGLRTINVSTGAAIVAAACGCIVAKHGNRAVSSKSGSADVLEALGVRVDADATVVEKCLADVGVGFLFAPNLHGAMKHAMPARKALGVRTIFNLLGPLTNPAGATRQLIGVFDRTWVRPIAEVLGALGAERALVAHGTDGMDEITVTGPTHLAEWRDGAVHEWEFVPASVGVACDDPRALEGGDAAENARKLAEILQGKDSSPAADIVLLNAGAVLYVANKVECIADGLIQARDAITSGAAWGTLERLRDVSQGAA